MFQRVKVDNSVWTLETEKGQRVLRIELDKNEGDHWWPYVVDSEKPIDVSKIEPPPSSLDEIDVSVRSQVEKMMVREWSVVDFSMSRTRSICLPPKVKC